MYLSQLLFLQDARELDMVKTIALVAQYFSARVFFSGKVCLHASVSHAIHFQLEAQACAIHNHL